MRYYPICLKLKDKNVFIVGGGKVAERKIKNLLAVKADIFVVSPKLTLALKRLYKQGKFNWKNKCVEKADLKEAQLVIAAASDTRVNKNVSAWAKDLGTIVNVVDNSRLSDFISPALFSKGKAIVAVYTDGKDPVLSRDLKNFLKEHWNEFLSYRHRL